MQSCTVAYLDRTISGEEYVERLDVAMQDTLRMDCLLGMAA